MNDEYRKLGSKKSGSIPASTINEKYWPVLQAGIYRSFFVKSKDLTPNTPNKRA
jgi:hypothetical protein